MLSTLFRRGAPGQGADVVSTAIHGGAAAVQKGDTLPPKDDNNAGLTPLCPCLKAPFGHQKVPAKPFLVHILDNITHKNNNLSGSDPLFFAGHAELAIIAIVLVKIYESFQHCAAELFDSAEGEGR